MVQTRLVSICSDLPASASSVGMVQAQLLPFPSLASLCSQLGVPFFFSFPNGRITGVSPHLALSMGHPSTQEGS